MCWPHGEWQRVTRTTCSVHICTFAAPVAPLLTPAAQLHLYESGVAQMLQYYSANSNPSQAGANGTGSTHEQVCVYE
jgi:hypothetical protein